MVQSAFDTALKLRNKMYYADLIRDLNEALSNLPGFQAVHFYGSRMSGLGNESSDLDVFIQISK